MDKKRKSSDSGDEVNALDLDLQEFNYEDMDNLNISDGEVTGEVDV